MLRQRPVRGDKGPVLPSTDQACKPPLGPGSASGSHWRRCARRLGPACRVLAFALALGVAALALAALYWRYLMPLPAPGVFGVPPKTQWRPPTWVTAPRAAPLDPRADDYAVQPEPTTFHTMHVGLENSDTLWTAAAPMFELDWVAEPEMYIPEGVLLLSCFLGRGAHVWSVWSWRG
jgi:hypothetical protein